MYHHKCRVFDAAGRELEEALSTDALVWEQEGNAIILEYTDVAIRSVRKLHKLPGMIMLKRKVNMKQKPDRPAPLTNENLFKRDHYTCQYCGRHQLELDGRPNPKTGRAREHLTRDHIVPKDRGGENTWENCTTACSTCNGAKGNQTLKEARMKLRSKPRAPKLSELNKR